MKTNAIVRIVIWSVVILLLLSILGVVLAFDILSFRFGPNISTDSDYQTADTSGAVQYADPGNVTDIEIDWVAGSITIQPGDVDSIEFSESSVSDDKYAMVWKQSGKTLSLQYCRESISFPSFGVNSGELSKDLVITVPRDWGCDSLEIDAASAELDIIDLTIQEVEIDTASGTCEFENCAIGSLDIDTASGDVVFSGTLNTLDFDGASADIRAVLANTPRSISLDGASGDLELTLPADCGFSVNIDAMSSDFSSEFETTVKNGSHVYGDGSCRIDVSAMSGDVIIRKGN